MNIKINDGITGEILVLNQTTFNNDVDTIQLRMTPEFLSLIKRHCSGAIDVSISALLDYGIKKILDENISISIQQIEKQIVIESVKRDSSIIPFTTVNYRASRKDTRPVFVRLCKDLKYRLKEISPTKYTLSAIGIIKYSIDTLLKNNQCLIIKSEVVYEK
ncbi:hypothetical protein KXZ61_24770 [Klebsiella pneumoniae]|uniref:hypothetical protein n=1 Tax=Klebsiella pneumoniae TaxID=573 RepID=UPI001CA4378C|nr:hypothetical protein [Klebsiella pneumoniae]MBY8376338.1 hypothetical protein [Klebsiella pneumoniae]